MAEIAELEERIRVLEDIEAIKNAKYRYWYCLDKKLWDELPDCFAENAVADYGPDPEYEGRFVGGDAIVRYCKWGTGEECMRTVHQGHNPQIEITGDGTARGTWELYFHMIDEEKKSVFQMGGFYHDEYVKEGEVWKISSQLFSRIFRERRTL